MDHLLFTLNTVAPVFLTILLGYLLKMRRVADDHFVERATTVVFYVGLPAAMITELSSSDFRSVMRGDSILIMVGATVAWFAVAWALAPSVTPTTQGRGAFVQGVFRGNLLLVGAPIVSRALGEHALAEAMVISAVVMPLYNVLAIVALLRTGNGRWWQRMQATIRQIATNPIILSVVVGMTLSLLRLRLPEAVHKTGAYLAQMTFPLALIAIGAGIESSTMAGHLRPALVATAFKNVALPLSAGAMAWFCRVPSRSIALLMLLAGTPTAVSSYIMARAMDSDAELAGAIVFVTTATSVVTLTLAVLVLRMVAFL